MRSGPVQPRYSCHLRGWIERIPGGTRQNDGLETGIMGGYGRDISVAGSRTSSAIIHGQHPCPSAVLYHTEIHAKPKALLFRGPACVQSRLLVAIA